MGKTAKHTNKEDLAYKHLWEMICDENRKVGDLLPTELEIAKGLGVNRLTVSKALAWLKNEGYISRRAGYGTTIERKPPSSSTRLILVISPWPEWERSANWYYSRLLYAVHAEALLNGATTVNVAFHATETQDEDFNRISNLYNAVKCEGVIVIDPYVATHDRLNRFLETIGCPSVWVDSSLQVQDNVHHVDLDNFQAAFDVTEKLIKYGAKRIAFMGTMLSTTARQLRFDGYKAALAANGIEFDERLKVTTAEDSYVEEAGNECAGVYAARKLDADALFVADSHMIPGIISFRDEFPTKRMDRLVQLPIATFDFDEKLLDGASVRFSVIQPVEELGRQAVQLFLSNQELKEPTKRKVAATIREFN
ncbi:MAG: GntR family transcriptional regulator [Coraliomargarita sp.]|nr:GntR family transcriptional regulator [Coraliomargarita sp.]